MIRRGCVSARERERVLQEIYALAAQGDNAHAVRYYSAWDEVRTGEEGGGVDERRRQGVGGRWVGKEERREGGGGVGCLSG